MEVTAVGQYEVTHSFVVSYVEVYMEKVHDLLIDVRGRQTLRRLLMIDYSCVHAPCVYVCVCALLCVEKLGFRTHHHETPP